MTMVGGSSHTHRIWRWEAGAEVGNSMELWHSGMMAGYTACTWHGGMHSHCRHWHHWRGRLLQRLAWLPWGLVLLGSRPCGVLGCVDVIRWARGTAVGRQAGSWGQMWGTCGADQATAAAGCTCCIASCGSVRMQPTQKSIGPQGGTSVPWRCLLHFVFGLLEAAQRPGCRFLHLAVAVVQQPF